MENREISVNDINRIHAEKEAIRLKIFNKILDRSYNRIKYSVYRETNFCLFQVPEFIIGIPLYDMQKCVYYIGLKLMKKGYNIKYYKPNIILISWKLKKPKITQQLMIQNQAFNNISYNNNISSNNIKSSTKHNIFRSIDNNSYGDDILFNNYIPQKK